MSKDPKDDWKKRQGVVYSTNQDFEYQHEQGPMQETLPVSQQSLRVNLDRSGRAGKTVTLVTGFVGNPADLESLGKLLKTRCGTGGTVKSGEILIQGDVRNKVLQILQKEGFRVKRGS